MPPTAAQPVRAAPAAALRRRRPPPACRPWRARQPLPPFTAPDPPLLPPVSVHTEQLLISLRAVHKVSQLPMLNGGAAIWQHIAARRSRGAQQRSGGGRTRVWRAATNDRANEPIEIRKCRRGRSGTETLDDRAERQRPPPTSAAAAAATAAACRAAAPTAPEGANPLSARSHGTHLRLTIRGGVAAEPRGLGLLGRAHVELASRRRSPPCNRRALRRVYRRLRARYTGAAGAVGAVSGRAQNPRRRTRLVGSFVKADWDAGALGERLSLEQRCESHKSLPAAQHGWRAHTPDGSCLPACHMS